MSRRLSSRSKPVRSTRLGLLSLEDRLVPATFTVSNLLDTGAGSLRAAVMSANGTTGADTIVFQAGLTGTITLANQLSLTDTTGATTIIGPGADRITVSGNNATRILQVSKSVSADVSGMTFTNGNAGVSLGGAVVGSGTMTFRSMVFDANKANSGGAIYSFGTVTIDRSVFSGNIAQGVNGDDGSATGGGGGGGGGAAAGGALGNQGTGTVTNSTFTGNQAIGGNGGRGFTNGGGFSGTGGDGGGNGGGTGGAPGLAGGAGGNFAGGGGGGGSTSVGGAGGNGGFGAGGGGGGARTNGGNGGAGGLGDTTAGGAGGGGNGGQAIASAAAGGGGGAGIGGAIYNVVGTLTLVNNTITGNSATKGLGGLGGTGGIDAGTDGKGLGGGIYNYAGPDGDGTLVMRNTIVALNTAENGPDLRGAAATSGNNLIGNTSMATGLVASDKQNVNPLFDARGLSSYGGTAKTIALQSGSPALNAGSNSAATGLTNDGRGAPFVRVSGTVEIGAYEAQATPASLVVNNAGDADDGNFGPGQLTLREAIRLSNNPGADTITFANGLGTITLAADLPALADTKTTIAGPGAANQTISGNDQFRIFNIDDGTSGLIDATISGLTLTKGRSTSMLGGAIFLNENLTLANTTLANNTGSGAIFNSNGTLTVTGSSFTGNQNNNSAAAILITGGKLVVTDSTFTNNAGAGRGAIFTDTAATITNSTFTGNTATGASGGGGAIFHRNGTLTINGGRFMSNSTNQNGGAINTQEGTLVVIGSAFDANKAGVNGGAIFNSAGATLTGISATGGIAANGAGLYNNGAAATMTVIDSTISGNSGFAAGIRNDSGTVNISGSTISGNTGNFNTGLSNFQGTMNVVNSTISGNISTASGGGVTNSGTLTLANSTVANNRDDSDGSGDASGGGLRNIASGKVTLTNTIVAGNFTGTSNTASDVVDPVTGILLANSKNNLIGDVATSGGFTNGTNGNRVGVSAGLLPLASNGGPTQTHALLAGSAAVNAGDDIMLTNDQRGAGFARISGGAVDIGAFELAFPANLVVDNAGDVDDGNFAAGQLTLREAIGLANARLGADTITFATGLGPVTTTAGRLTISDTIGKTTISGPAGDAQTVQRSADVGTPEFGLFLVNAGAEAAFNNLTISNGRGGDGGGIQNFGTTTITNSTFRDNSSQNNGGGIEISKGTVTVLNSTISGNTAGNVGGGINNFKGTLIVTNTTITGNKSVSAGGGIINTAGTLTLTHSTVTGNRTDTNDAGGVDIGGGIAILADTTINNTIVAGNFRGTGTTRDDISFPVGGSPISTANNNVIGDAGTSGGLTNGTNGNIVGVDVADVINTTLANNGGPTLTHALNPNGPALGAGSKSFMTAVDQRGFPRPADPTFFPDIGAVEPQLLALAPATLLNALTGTPYNQALTASLTGLPGGTSFTFSLAGGSLPNGLTLSPAGIISGTPTTPGTANFNIAVLASTGDLAFPTARSITVTDSNTPPTISDIGNQSGSINATFGPIGFTVADNETAAGALSVVAQSSNPTLVPINNVVFGGSGGNRTVTVTPANGQTGSATITVAVTDGNGATASDTFLVTVAAPPIGPNPLLVGFPQFSAGADAGGSLASLFDTDGTRRLNFAPFPGFTGGVRTATADFNGDGIADIVSGTGPGAPTLVLVHDGKTAGLLFQVAPFEASFTGGVYVAAGDVNGDGVPDLAITPDEGGGPRVDMYGGGQGFAKIVSFFGIDDPNFRGGARASIADMTGDGTGDLIVVAGFGGGPRVAGFDGTTLSKTPQKIFGDFFAFEQTLRNGIFVTAGDLNGDGFADLIAGGGPGGGPRVLAFDGKSLLSNQYVNLANFFGGDQNSRGGIRMAVKDLDGDNRADLVVGSGSQAGSRVTAYLGKNIAPAGTPPSALDFDSFAGFAGGVFVG